MIVGSTNLVIYTLNVGKRKFYLKAKLLIEVGVFFLVNCREYCFVDNIVIVGGNSQYFRKSFGREYSFTPKMLSLMSGKILIENIRLLAIVGGNCQRFRKTFAEILVWCKNVIVGGNSRLFRKRFEAFIVLFWAPNISLCSFLR